jgi:hypothetical protein
LPVHEDSKVWLSISRLLFHFNNELVSIILSLMVEEDEIVFEEAIMNEPKHIVIKFMNLKVENKNGMGEVFIHNQS